MNTSRKKVLWVLALVVGVVLVPGGAAFRSYRAACRTAERFVSGAPHGPWFRSKVRLVGDFNPDASPLAMVPHWVFRFRNPQNGNESKRIYVTFSGERVFCSERVLYPVPLSGAWR